MKGALRKEWTASPEDWAKTFEAVGRFLFNWSTVESQINDLITKGLRLDGMNSVVVTSNVQLRDKLHICATIIAMQVQKPEDWREDGADWLEKARKVSLNRNTVAHNVFVPWQQGIKFYHASAKGEIDVSPIEWRYSDIDAKIRKMDRIYYALQKIVEDITPPPLSGIAAAGTYADFWNSEFGQPKLGRGLLSSAYRAALQAQADQNSGGPNPALSGEMTEPPWHSLADLLAGAPDLPPLAEPQKPEQTPPAAKSPDGPRGRRKQTEGG